MINSCDFYLRVDPTHIERDKSSNAPIAYSENQMKDNMII